MQLLLAALVAGANLAAASWGPTYYGTVSPVSVVSVVTPPASVPVVTEFPPSMTTYETGWSSLGIPTTSTIVAPCPFSISTTTITASMADCWTTTITTTTTLSLPCPCQWSTSTSYSPVMTSSTCSTTTPGWTFAPLPPPPPPPATSLPPLTTMVTVTPTPVTVTPSFSKAGESKTSSVRFTPTFTGAAANDGKPMFGAGLAIMVA